MLYNDRVTFIENKLDGVKVPANVSTMGAKEQSLVFGDVKQTRVIVRFKPAIAVRMGYFTFNGKEYLIKSNLTVGDRTVLTGVEDGGTIRPE